MNNIVRRAARMLMHFVQWGVVVFLAFLALGSVAVALDRRALGIDVTVYLLACAAMAVVALALSPPVFFRLPAKGRIASYALAPAALAAFLWTSDTVNQAYERTPEGSAAARAQANSEATAAASRSERARKERQRLNQEENQKASLALLEEHERNAAELQRRVQRCINWQGQMPALVQGVKEGLHNPRSFEHVQTELRTIGDTPAVVMEYRAENGFGAIRTEAVSAFVSPGDCSVLAVKEYEPEDFQPK